ncbi:hypothetical protein FNU76_21995 [Chitinimonas arctica]|uniref:Uncharacterized protein n=1 Tax=Chitinimonas arctica TaxID=2594795 RepID=A0A516SKW1_9NEIS|nr:hypothetical protein [Chitinimonas arctica]QDQ28807.1 hypothetical protein FNU76_21995 [Chitinimonas arctica]
MKIFGQRDNIYDAVDAILTYGVVAIHGTKTPASLYSERLIKCLGPYRGVEPVCAYQTVPNNGYLYYVYDARRYHPEDEKLRQIILDLDARYSQSQFARHGAHPA